MDLRKLKILGSGIKVIICDLDQTLLNSNKKISQSNLDAIQAAQNKSIFVTICSGRIFTMLDTYVHDINIQGPLISTNGAAIIDTRDKKILWSKPVDRETAFEIMEYARSQGYDYSALTGNACYFSPNSIRIRWFLQYNEIAAARKMKTIPLIHFNDNHSIVEGDIYKVLIYELDPCNFKSAASHLRSIEGISCTSSENGLMDIMAANVDKGSGVAHLKQILGVSQEEVCVFGDYINDLPMFREAGFPIAMANAHEKVKDYALAVTDSNDSDGIAKAIYQYIL